MFAFVRAVHASMPRNLASVPGYAARPIQRVGMESRVALMSSPQFRRSIRETTPPRYIDHRPFGLEHSCTAFLIWPACPFFTVYERIATLSGYANSPVAWHVLRNVDHTGPGRRWRRMWNAFLSSRRDP